MKILEENSALIHLNKLGKTTKNPQVGLHLGSNQLPPTCESCAVPQLNHPCLLYQTMCSDELFKATTSFVERCYFKSVL